MAMDPLDRKTYDISEVKGSTSAGWPSTRGQGWHGGHAGSGGVETKATHALEAGFYRKQG